MIIDKVENNVLKSSNFESTDFRIDARYKNKVLWMLINQYRHKVRTPVQEIISNARDAQRENGNPDKAIKIQLPTKIEPTFIVRDFGVGMDENRIKTIFTSFGASTKNADNSQTGGFGIGAKSPLAYTDSFNIKTYVDGKYWFYVIAKTKDDGIGINLLDSGTSTEENGTEVQIPVKPSDTQDFKKAACRCTMFWKIQPTFNLDDEDLIKVEKGTVIADKLTLYNKDNLGDLFYNELIILVDGIPYEIDGTTSRSIDNLSRIMNTINYSSRLVFELNTGDIDLLQTRESIEDTEKTTLKLTELANNARFDLDTHIKSCLNAKSLEGRLEQYKVLTNSFRNVKTHDFMTFSMNHRWFYVSEKLRTLTYNYKGVRGTVTTPQRHVNEYHFSHTSLGTFYYDDLKGTESDTMKARRMRNHLTTTGETVTLITQGFESNRDYMTTLRLLKVKKLSSLEKPSKTKRSMRSDASRVVREHDNITMHSLFGGYGYRSKVIKTTTTDLVSVLKNKYVYIEYSKSNRYLECAKFIEVLRKEYKVTPCKISMRDIKLIKDNPNFQHIDSFMATFTPTKNVMEYLVTSCYKVKRSLLAKVIIDGSNRISDKILVTMAKAAKCKTDKKGRVEPMKLELGYDFKQELLKKHRTYIDNRVTILERFDNRIESKYPMLITLGDNYYNKTNRKEQVNYINSRRK